MIRAIDFARQLHIKVNHGGECLGRCIVPLSPLMQRPQFCGWFALRDQKGTRFVPGSLFIKIVWQVEYGADSDVATAAFIAERARMMRMTDRGEEEVRPADPTFSNSLGPATAAAAVGASNPFARAAAESARDSSFGDIADGGAQAAGDIEVEESDDDSDPPPPPPPEAETVSIAVCQWNVGKQVPCELDEWLQQGPRLVVVSAQECSYAARAIGGTCANDWLATCQRALGDGYQVCPGRMEVCVL
jgi:hypothetical protein